MPRSLSASAWASGDEVLAGGTRPRRRGASPHARRLGSSTPVRPSPSGRRKHGALLAFLGRGRGPRARRPRPPRRACPPPAAAGPIGPGGLLIGVVGGRRGPGRLRASSGPPDVDAFRRAAGEEQRLGAVELRADATIRRARRRSSYRGPDLVRAQRRGPAGRATVVCRAPCRPTRRATPRGLRQHGVASTRPRFAARRAQGAGLLRLQRRRGGLRAPRGRGAGAAPRHFDLDGSG